MQEKWSVLDTLDGLFAKYDKPISNKNIVKLLKDNNFKVINNDQKNNIFQTKIKLPLLSYLNNFCIVYYLYLGLY